MKDYLEENLSIEEDDEILGIIWKTAQKYKLKIYNEKKLKTVKTVRIEDADTMIYDTYKVEETKLQNVKDILHPFSQDEKTTIVNELNNLLDALCLMEIKRTLTFNEKLVFVLVYMEEMTRSATANLLQVQRKTIYNRCKCIDRKVQKELYRR